MSSAVCFNLDQSGQINLVMGSKFFRKLGSFQSLVSGLNDGRFLSNENLVTESMSMSKSIRLT